MKNTNVVTINKAIGKLVRAKRIIRGMSQDALAEKVGYKNKASIQMIEQGMGVPDKKRAAFAEVLKLPEEFLDVTRYPLDRTLTADELDNIGMGTFFLTKDKYDSMGQNTEEISAKKQIDDPLANLEPPETSDDRDFFSYQPYPETSCIMPDNSMQGFNIPRGATLLIDSTITPKNGDIVAIKSDDKIYIRQITYAGDRSFAILSGSGVTPITLDKPDKCFAIGVCVACTFLLKR